MNIPTLNNSIQSEVSDIFQCDGNVTIKSSSSESKLNDDVFPISVHITLGRSEIPSFSNKQPTRLRSNLITVKRSNKLLEATNVPVVVNLNPRSLYNKQDEFRTMIEQTEAGICCVSETWDRSHVAGGKLIADLLEMEGYRWIKNVIQRKRKGGKPAILANENDYFIKDLCPGVITVPTDVEVVWALLTPKHRASNSKIRHIAVASVYYSSSQTRKSDFLDHISEAYHILCSKYGSDLKFLIVGDVNKLKLKPILNLSPNLRQVLKAICRHNPDETQDVIHDNQSSIPLPPPNHSGPP